MIMIPEPEITQSLTLRPFTCNDYYRLNAGRDWGQEKGTTEDEMAGWHHRLDGHGFE